MKNIKKINPDRTWYSVNHVGKRIRKVNTVSIVVKNFCQLTFLDYTKINF